MLEIWPENVQPSNKFLAYFAAAQELKEKKEAEGGKCRSILVVDDEESVANTTVEILNRAGFCAFVAYDGETALELAAKFHPDILLTDVVMPSMSGRQVADALSGSRPGMKVLYLSGYTDNTVVHHGVLESGVNFLPKPFSRESLAKKIREVLSKT